MTSVLELAVLGIAVIAAHTCSSYFHEALFKPECVPSSASSEPDRPVCGSSEAYAWPGFRFPWLLTLFEYLCYALLNYAVGGGTARRAARDALKTPMVWRLTVAHLGAHGLTNAALKHVNFATKLVFKSCKVLPVMVGGVLVLGKRYSMIEYACATAMVAGLCAFSLADASAYPDYDSTGIALCAASLVCESFVGNIQERLLKGQGGDKGGSAPMPAAALGAVQFALGAPLALAVAAVNGEAYAFTSGWLTDARRTDRVAAAAGEMVGVHTRFLAAWRRDALYRAVMFVLPMFIGLRVIFAVVGRHGAVATVAITTTRRFLTMAISFIMFPKPFTRLHAQGLAFVVGSALVLTMLKLKSSAQDAINADDAQKLRTTSKIGSDKREKIE